MNRRSFLKTLVAISASVPILPFQLVEATELLGIDAGTPILDDDRGILIKDIIITDTEVLPKPNDHNWDWSGEFVFRGIAYKKDNPSKKKYFLVQMKDPEQVADKLFLEEMYQQLDLSFKKSEGRI